MNIDNALREFVKTFQNSSKSMGVMKYSQEELTKENINPPLNGEILYFYNHVILEDKPTFGGDFFLQFIERDELKSILSGWAVPGDRLGWSDDYIIFSERNGDVLFCDSSDNESPVYGSVQKKNYKLTNSLSDFLIIYSRLINLEEVDFAGNTTDDDFNYKPEYLSKVKEELNNSISSELVDDFMYFFFE